MRTFRVVTTCHQKGWEQYGRRMVESFRDLWPHDVHIAVYAEGFSIENFSPRVHQRELPLWLQDFRGRHQDNMPANGLRTKDYNYKFDAVRFAHKIGAVTAEFFGGAEDVLIWIDADTVTHSRVTKSFIEWLLPDGADLAWLDREHMYPECGFYMMNRRSAAMVNAMHKLILAYDTDRVFQMQEWHDSFVFQQIMEAADIRRVSLSGEFRNHSHPFINGPLGSVMDHMKGPRKFEGKSRRGDLRRKRQEAYWS